ncbi:hypothetical protein ACWERE_38085, partial [Rhodococcus koreensis]
MSRPWEQIALFDVHEPSAPDPAADDADEIDEEETAAPDPAFDDAGEIDEEETAEAEPAESSTPTAAADLPTAPETEPATTPPGRPVWESLPVGVEADGHAVIVTAAGTYTPSGRELTGPVDSVEKLDKL